jgi:cytochrome c oxidase assembly protein subunit 15
VISRALHLFVVLTAAVTFVLLGAGGLVTSHGVGMAVPDWPNTFGYNMFFFPVSQWVGGVFYEHTHRLLASGVGLLTTVMALWLHGRKARRFLRWTGLMLIVLAVGTALALPKRSADALVLGLSGFAALAASIAWPSNEPAAPWLRRLGVVAFGAVVLQGILGGLRVVLFKDQIGIFHATLAQLFFVLLCALALFTSHWWQTQVTSATIDSKPPTPSAHMATVSWICCAAVFLILSQLILGATMRHQHAGLSIPDFPFAYGKLWPAMDPQSVALYNQRRIEVVAANPITAFQVGLQMVHRLMALCILIAVAAAAWFTNARLGSRHPVARLTLLWLGLILVQAALGAFTIWSNKAADVATAHVLVGALSLACGTMVSIVLFALVKQFPEAAKRASPQPMRSSFNPRPSPAVGFE